MNNKYLFTTSDEISAEGFGVKAVNLYQLSRLNYPIPCTVFLSILAFTETLENVEQGNQTDEVMTPDNFSRVLNSAAMPRQLMPELMAWCDELNGVGDYLLAVRSSSTHEDWQDLSFAGLYHSILNVKPVSADLEQAIKQVWASTRSEEVLSYCQKNGVDSSQIKMGVVIQQMVKADFSGVLFTGNPQDGSDDIRLEFVQGIGESLVSGEQTPVSMVYHRQNAGWQENDSNSTLDQGVLSQLITTALEIEEFAGRPVDIEWALSGENLFLLQYRPVTVRSSGLTEEIEWTNENVGEVIPDVVTPFSWSILGPMVNNAVNDFLKKLSIKHYPQEGLFGLYKGKVYFNSTRFNQFINRFYPSAYFSTNNKAGLFFRLGIVFKLLRFSAPALVFTITLPRHIKKLLSKELPQTGDSDDEHCRLQALFDLIRQESECMSLHIAGTILAEIYYQAVKKFSAKWFNGDEVFSAESLMLGATETPGAESGSMLWQLSRAIKNDPQIIEVFINSTPTEIETKLEKFPDSKVSIRIKEYFMNHGHNALHEFELLYPRWHEDRVYIYAMIKSYLDMSDADDPVLKRQKLHETGIETRLQAYQKLNLLQRVIFKYFVNSTICFSSYREQLKQRFLKLHCQVKLHLTNLSHDMNFDDPLDIMFLEIDEVKSLIERNAGGKSLKASIPARRMQRSEFQDYAHPPRLIQTKNQWREIWADDSSVGGEMSGIGCCGGIVEGRVRVMCKAEEFGAFNAGEILVTRSTNPSWTPLFLLAAGIVTEIGGVLSHGAIIAREYGKPMVAAVPEATERLKDGDWIRIDGSAGRVLVFNQPEKLRID